MMMPEHLLDDQLTNKELPQGNYKKLLYWCLGSMIVCAITWFLFSVYVLGIGAELGMRYSKYEYLSDDPASWQMMGFILVYSIGPYLLMTNVIKQLEDYRPRVAISNYLKSALKALKLLFLFVFFAIQGAIVYAAILGLVSLLLYLFLGKVVIYLYSYDLFFLLLLLATYLVAYWNLKDEMQDYEVRHKKAWQKED